ncbi:MAG: DegT/DnrJ/EryC1/StrS family aminotransferase [Owenweeksia sp.]
MTERIYLSPPHLNGSEAKALENTLSTNWVAPVGPQLDKWEEEITNRVEAAACCLTNSGTAAIHLALRALGVGRGSVVFVQSHTHIGSVNPILYLGAIPVFIDSEPGSWNMSPAFLEEAIQALEQGGLRDKLAAKYRVPEEQVQARCILPIHLYGMPAPMDRIMEISGKYNIPVLEDSAEALGSSYNGKPCGGIAQAGVFSFNGNKIITTGGGGAVVARSADLIKKVKYWATQATEPAPHYQHHEMGYNYRMSNVLAGLGREQFRFLGERIAQRQANFTRYMQYFQKTEEYGYQVSFQEEATGSSSNRWLTAVLIDPAKNKGIGPSEIRAALENANIESRLLWKPMHLQPLFAEASFFGDGTSERLFNTGLCLPSGSGLTSSDFTRIFKVLDAVFCS